MPKKFVDLRSDTVTQPTAGMRRAMAEAAVGDDVYNEDPTVLELQRRLAELLGKEAALLVPSGTMSNQIAVRLHCKPGDEFICEAGCHIYNYEQAAYAQLSGVAARAVEGKAGVLEIEQLQDLVRPSNEHLPQTRLLCLENTHNRGAGRVQPLDNIVELCDWAQASGLATHLDGARLFNAVVATAVPAAEWSAPFDTVSVCFSKGLGAPVGSALAGSQEAMAAARRHRKLFGGGMRQAGILAAAALYALEHHVDRLADDHRRAQRLAEHIRRLPGLKLAPEMVETNMVIFAIAPELGTAAEFCARLKDAGVLMLPISKTTVRAVTHLDVDDEDTHRAIAAIDNAIRSAQAAPPQAEQLAAF